MPLHLTDQNRQLLQATVAAKIQYWDAIRALETALTDGGEFTDLANDVAHDVISTLAAGLDTPEQAFTHIDDTHLTYLLEKVKTA